jgi:hypothetical protein
VQLRVHFLLGLRRKCTKAGLQRNHSVNRQSLTESNVAFDSVFCWLLPYKYFFLRD